VKAADLVLEFVITGSVGLLLILLIPVAAGVGNHWDSVLPDDPATRGLAGVLALPAIYYLGIAVHHASWWLWRRLFHRRRFAQIFKSLAPSRSHKAMRELATSAYLMGGSPLGENPTWEARIEWCRFALLQYASADALREYERQYHLYRVAYGPLSALALGLLFGVVRTVYEPSSWWLPAIILAVQKGTG
jgi:hypothetical protein